MHLKRTIGVIEVIVSYFLSNRLIPGMKWKDILEISVC